VYIRAAFKPKVYAMSLHGAKGWRKGKDKWKRCS